MPLLLRSSLRYYLQHRWQGLLAVIGVALGVAIVLAVDLAGSSANTAFIRSAEQIKGATTHRVIGASGHIDERVYTALATVSPALSIAPVITHWVELENHKQDGDLALQIFGIDPFAEGPFRASLENERVPKGLSKSWFTQPGAVLISNELAQRLSIAKGDPLIVRQQGKPTTLWVIGFHKLPSNLLLMDIATAQEATGMLGLLTHIDIITDAIGLHSLKHLLPPSVRLVNAQQEIDGIAQLSSAFQLNLTALSLLALLVGMFLIFNAISFSFVQRRILIGRLRAIGVTEHELFKWLLVESLILGLLGCLLGTALGVWLGSNLTQLAAGTINELYYRVSVEGMTLQRASLIKALLLGMGGSILAALIPAHQAAKAPPISALSRAYFEQKTQDHLPRISLAGTILLILGLAIAQLEPAGLIGGFVGIFLLVLGTALLTPTLFHLSYRLLSHAPIPLLARMAVRDMNRHLSRLSIAGAALMVALAAGMSIGIMVDSMRGAVNSWLSDLLNADIYVTHPLHDEGALLSATTIQRLTRLPSVTDYSLYRHRALTINNRAITLVAARLAERSRTGFSLLTPNPKAVWQGYNRGEILISEPLAYRLSLAAGDQLTLPTQLGSQPFKVAGIFRDYASEHGRLFINLQHYQQAWQDRGIGDLSLLSEAKNLDRLIQQIETQRSNSNAFKITRGQSILDESQAIFDRTFRITEVLHLLALSIAFVGVLSALMALQLERAKEYAVLRALGFTRKQIGGLISLGSLSLGFIASIASIPTGLLMAWLLVNTIQVRAFGWTLPFEVSGAGLLQSFGIGVLAAGLAALYPAWRSSHAEPADGLREE